MAFWLSLRLDVPEVNRFDRLADMLEASDAVVVAAIESAEISRSITGDAAGSDLTYIKLVLRVDRVIAGSAPATVPLEFLSAATPQQAQSHVAALRASIPRASPVFFLHEKEGPGEEGLYRLTNQRGLWTTTPRATVDAPLQETAPAVSGLFASEIDSVQTMDGFIALIEHLSSGAR